MIKDDIQVSNAHLLTLFKQAGQITRPNVELDAEVLSRVAPLANKLRELLVVPHMVRSLLLFEDLEHRHVLLDETCVFTTELTNRAKSLASVRQELKDV